ncbi:transcription factor bHLH140-like [Pyrus ussuriensis x Pyrus communis]|uniref:Transcription factor bHLH140-like n=1 Tax=Pyrus ussuriensis x Pyrus communis TaxID=2448454 RepID=A0A5N5HVF8_9ROSA|nr:transcription factor bHLH140-like [Pyrus ussuriensis x Pyrus communis]
MLNSSFASVTLQLKCKVWLQSSPGGSPLFEGFATIVRTQAKSPKGSIENLQAKLPESQERSDERSKRSQAYQDDTEDSNTGKPNLSNQSGGSRTKSWGSWAQALYNNAMHPEKHKDAVLEISDDVVVLNDLYPKAKRHVLVMARWEGLDRLSDVHKEHLPLLRTMHDVGLKERESRERMRRDREEQE